LCPNIQAISSNCTVPKASLIVTGQDNVKPPELRVSVPASEPNVNADVPDIVIDAPINVTLPLTVNTALIANAGY